MTKLITRLWKDESGQDLVEYAILIALVALTAVATLGTLANTIKNVFSSAATKMNTT